MAEGQQSRANEAYGTRQHPDSLWKWIDKTQLAKSLAAEMQEAAASWPINAKLWETNFTARVLYFVLHLSNYNRLEASCLKRLKCSLSLTQNVCGWHKGEGGGLDGIPCAPVPVCVARKRGCSRERVPCMRWVLFERVSVDGLAASDAAIHSCLLSLPHEVATRPFFY